MNNNSNFTDEEMDIINLALVKFEKSLTLINRGSADAFALVIFINACYDTGKYQSNRYSALVHFSQARQSANFLEGLCSKNIVYFHAAIKHAHQILINSNIVHPDLCFG